MKTEREIRESKKKGGAKGTAVKRGKPAGSGNAKRGLADRLRKVEAARQASEDKYRALIENASQGIAIVQDDRFIYSNKAFRELGGWDEDVLYSAHIDEIVHPDDKSDVADRRRRRLAGEKIQGVYPFRFLAQSGEARWVETKATLIEWEGRPAVLYFFTDITKRVEAQAEIALKAMLLDAVGDSVFLRELDGSLLYFNRAAHSTRGFTAEEMARTKAGDMDEGIHEGQMAARTETIMREGASVFTSRHRCKDGSVIDVELHSRKVSHGGKDRILTVTRDITRRKKAEEDLEASNMALQKAFDNAVSAMAKIVEIRDPYTAGHQRRVAGLSRQIAREMGLFDVVTERLYMAATIHDIGKIYIPSEILSKPGKLGEIEMGLVKNHPAKGHEIVESLALPHMVGQAIVQHHERQDGSGYPDGLKGEDICIEARILAVADVVEAMASHRPYRPALGLEAALAEIEGGSGKLYYPVAVDACLRLFREKGFKFEM